MTLDDAVRVFLADRVDRGCGIHALKSYSQHLTLLSNFLSSPETESLNTEHLNDYLNHLRSQELSLVTIRQRATAVKTFLKWLKRRKLIQIDIDDFHIPKQPHILPKAVPIDEIKKLASAKHVPTRDKAITFLALDAGLRRCEISDLKVNDIDLNRSLVFVRCGKGGKQRYSIFANRTCKTLRAWIRKRKAQPGVDRLFVTKDGLGIQPGGIYKAIRRTAKHAGISARPHRLRHTFATNYLNQGGNLHDLQMLMGHESITTTMKYVSVSLEKIRQGYKQLSLLDNL